ncbi:hypothetical protein BACSTE_01688 [Bacteroides stercoris ATCC 43183]|uniref:Uncharacterized protein n=1 Tax=Bacteroides stercoris ATCC 43183 TaxID=449673 RepID=B0NQN9_BACSE|nr:hypothetical protein BACSTE_01688 [Bacteroides stercoris ATCC 43183]
MNSKHSRIFLFYFLFPILLYSFKEVVKSNSPQRKRKAHIAPFYGSADFPGWQAFF